jgi:hypothetical protein
VGEAKSQKMYQLNLSQEMAILLFLILALYKLWNKPVFPTASGMELIKPEMLRQKKG